MMMMAAASHVPIFFGRESLNAVIIQSKREGYARGLKREFCCCTQPRKVGA